MKTKQITRMAIIGLLLVSGAFAQSQSKSNPQKPKPSGQQGMMSGQMMERCKMMMERRQQMQAEMKAMDAELDKLVAEMNSVPASQKTDAVAAVVTKMVEQRKVMHEKRDAMQTRMMQHIMEHMQTGQSSMSGCPMMQEMMQDMKDTKKTHPHGN